MDTPTKEPLQLMTLDCGFRNHSILLICSMPTQTCTDEDLSDEQTSVDTYLNHVCLSYHCINKDPLYYLRI